MSNSDKTVVDRMAKAGLPYEITGNETPVFMLSGALGDHTAVVAVWRDSTNDNERAFVGFYAGFDALSQEPDEAEQVAQRARKVRGCHTAYTVHAQAYGR